MQKIAAFVGFEVDGKAALVAVESGKESGAKADQPPGGVAVGRFDLDHIGAEIGKDQARGRAHDGMTEFKHADAVERPCVIGKLSRIGHHRNVC